jgi:Rrf2 family protein
MRSDNRLSRMLHVLIHMDERDAPMTSEAISEMLNINAVVVRRTMAGLRNKGLVQSSKGHGGGWQLTQALDNISLLDIYEALGQPPIFAMGLADDRPDCLVEQSVHTKLEAALSDARARLLLTFSETSLASVADDFQIRAAAKRKPAARR